MSRVRLLVAAALLVLAAYVGVRALLRPEPYATLAREYAPPGPAAPPPPAPAAPPGPAARAPAAAPPGPAAVPPRVAVPPRAAVPPPPASRRDPPPAGAVRAALLALDRARAAGYADPVAADPDAWAARSCACHAEDVRRLRALAAAGRALRGHAPPVPGVTLLRAGPAFADVAVAERLGAYRAVDARGRTVARWPTSGTRRWLLRLVRVDGRWLLGRVARAP